MSRWTGTWLSGSGAAFEPGEGESTRWRGERYGMPENGAGSVASPTVRLGGLLLDLVVASLCTMLFVRYDVTDTDAMWTFNTWAGVAWFVITVIGVGLPGMTPGMMLLGIRVVRMDGAGIVGPLRAVGRALLVALILPAALADRDGRGLHDKLAGTIPVRTR